MVARAQIMIYSEYSAKREQRRQASAASGTGFVDGLVSKGVIEAWFIATEADELVVHFIQKGGGVSLVRGLADGIGGLVTTPVKEARTGGVGGFFKGMNDIERLWLLESLHSYFPGEEPCLISLME